MTRALVSLALVLAGATATPAAAGGPAERGVAACRAELAGRFGPGEIRHYRIASIEPSSRRTRVSFVVNADRRYVFECAADRQGRVETASLDPARPDERQLAGDAEPR